MGETTAISWTDHTFNPWWGCTKVAPGCEHCYAALFDKRVGGTYFSGITKPRRTNPQNWKKPLKWNKEAINSGKRKKVFCGSMMDWCDKDAPEGALSDLFELIKATPMLDWQLLTKRAERIRDCLPSDWADGYHNVWLGVTVEDKKHGLSRAEKLMTIPAEIKFLSIEPLLECLGLYRYDCFDWVIVGGESGQNARPMNVDWVRYIKEQCDTYRVPFFFKQHGGNKADKGGCLLDGLECKDWPRDAA